MKLIFVLLLVLFTIQKKDGVLIKLRNREVSAKDAARRDGSDFSKAGLYAIHTEDLEALEDALGKRIEHRDVLHRDAYLVYIENAAIAQKLGKSTDVHVEKYLPGDKSYLDFSVNEKYGFKDVELVVEVVRGWDFWDIENEEMSIKMVSQTRARVRMVGNYGENLQKLKEQEGVIWIERYNKPVFLNVKNYDGNDVLQGSPTSPPDYTLHHYGLTGEGQIIGIGDSGLDVTNCMFHDPNVDMVYNEFLSTHRKIYYYEILNMSHAGECTSCGHGTHVSGSAAGNCYISDELVKNYNGAAPDTKIFFQDIGLNDGSLDIPEDLYNDFFPQAYDAGVRTHSNSWGLTIDNYYYSCVYNCYCTWNIDVEVGGVVYKAGTEVPTEVCQYSFGIASGRCCELSNSYSEKSASVDKFTFENDELLVLFANGNEGAKSDKGVVGSPATSKNCLSVGASQNKNSGYLKSINWTDYSEFIEYVNYQCSTTWTSSSQCCEATINTIGDCSGNENALETIKENCCPEYQLQEFSTHESHYNDNNMADFSSVGPTSDGRIKPEVVAPGTQIVSAKSQEFSVATNHCSNYEDTEDLDEYALCVMQGTSMATPMLAGTTTLVRQYFEDGYYPTGEKVSSNEMDSVSGMLVKAVMIHSAQPMEGLIFKNEKYNELPSTWPNNIYGWGLVKIGETLKFKDVNENYDFLVRNRVTIKDGKRNHYYLKAEGEGTFKATITWFEPDVSAGSKDVVLNNLNLKVTVGSTVYWGNNVEDGDEINVVEKVIIDGISDGDEIHVEVIGESVVTPDLNYALVVSGTSLSCNGDYSLDDACESFSLKNAPLYILAFIGLLFFF